jgi:tripartite-type tricarboxylate transporter receptor subunit TctC
MKFVRFNRRTALLCVMAVAAGAASAQPNTKTIRLMVGYSAGGPVDQVARLLAPALGAELGASVMVENKTGANPTAAVCGLRRARPSPSVPTSCAKCRSIRPGT